MPKPDKAAPSIRDLYPYLSEKELQAAEENLDAYLELVLEIYERIREDPRTYELVRRLLARALDSNPNAKH